MHYYSNHFGVDDGLEVVAAAVATNYTLGQLLDSSDAEDDIVTARLARRVLADYAEVEDLITIGAYKAGQNPKVDYAVSKIDALREFLMQTPEEKVDRSSGREILNGIFSEGS